MSRWDDNSSAANDEFRADMPDDEYAKELKVIDSHKYEDNHQEAVRRIKVMMRAMYLRNDISRLKEDLEYAIGIGGKTLEMDTGEDSVHWMRLGLSMAYRSEQQYEKAIHQIKLVESKSKNPILVLSAQSQHANVLLATENYGEVLEICHGIMKSLEEDIVHKDVTAQQRIRRECVTAYKMAECYLNLPEGKDHLNLSERYLHRSNSAYKKLTGNYRETRMSIKIEILYGSILMERGRSPCEKWTKAFIKATEAHDERGRIESLLLLSKLLHKQEQSLSAYSTLTTAINILKYTEYPKAKKQIDKILESWKDTESNVQKKHDPNTAAMILQPRPDFSWLSPILLENEIDKIPNKD